MRKITEAAQRKSKATDEAYFQKTKELVQNVPRIVMEWGSAGFSCWAGGLLRFSPPPPPSNRNRIAHILMVSSPDLSFQRINCLSLLRGMNSYGIPALHCVYGKMLSIKWPKCSFSSNPWVIYSIPSDRFMTLFRNMDLKIRNSKHVLNHGSMNSFCKRPDQYFQLVSHTIFTQPS